MFKVPPYIHCLGNCIVSSESYQCLERKMAPRNSKKRHLRGHKKVRCTSEPSSGDVQRSNKIFGAANEADLHTNILTREFLLTSSAGGVPATVVSDYSNAAADLSNLVNMFDEYRVLAIEIWYVPNNRYSKSVTVTTPLLIVVDHNNNAALFSYSGAVQHASCKGLFSMTRLNIESNVQSLLSELYYIKC